MRSRRGEPLVDPERPAWQHSRRRRLPRARARPCARRRPLVQQRGQRPRPQGCSLRARPAPQRTVGGSHRQFRGHRERTPEFEQWHHAVDHLPEPPLRTRPGLAQRSLLPTLRPRGGRIRSATAGMPCQQHSTPAHGSIRQGYRGGIPGLPVPSWRGRGRTRVDSFIALQGPDHPRRCGRPPRAGQPSPIMVSTRSSASRIAETTSLVDAAGRSSLTAADCVSIRLYSAASPAIDRKSVRTSTIGLFVP